VGRLVEARNGLGVESFEFDPAGNLLGEPQRVAEDLAKAQAKAQEWGLLRTVPMPTATLLDNLLRKFGDASFEHDERGNRLKAQHPGERRQVFEWDGFGRLRRFEVLHDAEVCYFYDPLGRRVGKESCAVVLHNSDAGSGFLAPQHHFGKMTNVSFTQCKSVGRSIFGGGDGSTGVVFDQCAPSPAALPRPNPSRASDARAKSCSGDALARAKSSCQARG
jgi:YD repeat-containing protein